MNPSNPLIAPFDSPLGIPPFDLIGNDHFAPAILEGIAAQVSEIEAITHQNEAPTFLNTIEALEQSGRLLERVNTVFSNLNSAYTNDDLQAIAREMSPHLSAHRDDVLLNPQLFARIIAVWENRAQEQLNPEQSKLLERKYKAFVRNGAMLGEADKDRLRALNARLSLLSLQFGENLLAETNGFALNIEREDDLKGLPEWLVQAAAEEARQRGLQHTWTFTLHGPSVLPFLQYADNLALRKQLWEAYVNRGNNDNPHDNKSIISEMVALRAERSALLGHPHYAAYSLEESMAGSVMRVQQLLDELWQPALAAAQREAKLLEDFARKDHPSFGLKPWDWRYYEEKVRASAYALDEEALKPYLSLQRALNGVFMVAEKLYGLHFQKLEENGLYHADAEAYEVTEADGSRTGVLLIDLYARPSKRGGAWMTSYRKQEMQHGQRVTPVISIVCNFATPKDGAQTLLTVDEVNTLFHEFGHALHGLLSNVHYRSLAGTAVHRDFVELPSQVLENWAMAPDVLRKYALHLSSGEAMPDALIEKLEQSSTFGQGFATVEYLASTFLDLAYHTQQGPLKQSPQEFEAATLAAIGMLEAIVPRHRSTYFSHVFSGGYAAGYYSYIWSAVLDTDAFEAFVETGDLFNPAVAASFRKNVLASGGTGEPMDLYTAFRGSEPAVEPLLRKRGLVKSIEV